MSSIRKVSYVISVTENFMDHHLYENWSHREVLLCVTIYYVEQTVYTRQASLKNVSVWWRHLHND